MSKTYHFFLTLLLASFPLSTLAEETIPEESVIYSVYRGVDLGENYEKPLKDFYVNMGKKQGVQPGTILNVLRKIATYDLVNRKLKSDIIFRIAELKVIYADQETAIARVHRMLPADQTPTVSPNAVMVGDIVRVANR